MYTCIHVYTYEYTYIYIYIYTHVYTHTHTFFYYLKPNYFKGHFFVYISFSQQRPLFHILFSDDVYFQF